MKEWLEKYLQPLTGGEITKVETFQEYGGVWPRLYVKNGDEEYVLEISQDPEGNGPGFIFGLPDPAAAEDDPPSA